MDVTGMSDRGGSFRSTALHNVSTFGAGMSFDRMAAFRAKFEIADSGCWLWTASQLPDGYGHFWNGTRMQPAHRWAYEQFVGPIPEGLEIDHLCKVRNCVNPDHLEPVTHDENCRRSSAGDIERAKTQCPKGHPYDDENTLWLERTGRPGRWKRSCRACTRDRMARKRWAARLTRSDRSCAMCGAFMDRTVHLKRLFCSQSCRRKADNEARRMSRAIAKSTEEIK